MTRTGSRPAPPPVDLAALRGWLTGRLPDAWFTGPPEVVVDRDEVLVVGDAGRPASGRRRRGDRAVGGPPRTRHGLPRADPRRAHGDRAGAARPQTGRAVSWGVTIGGERVLFTHQAVPVMTRLRQPERQVLDTLVAGGVAQVTGRRARVVRAARRSEQRGVAR